jgi:CBS domain containing-hemolysin-like protein
MSSHSLLLAAASALLALALMVTRWGGGSGRHVRNLVHAASILGFTAAGWSVARDGRVGTGLVVLVVGLLWTGFVWISSIRRSWLAGRNAGPTGRAGDVGREGGDLSEGREDGLEPRSRVILDRLLAMKELKIGSIATPRERLVFADCSGGVTEALQKMRETRHLRIPMVDGSIDRIVGVLHAKDIVPVAIEGGPIRPLKTLMRRPIFVSKETSTAILLELFRAQRGHMAILVDAYNRTFGLVTREDLFLHLSGGQEERS